MKDLKEQGAHKKRPRIEAIDLLRGLFIVVMLIDHIARFPNGLDYFSGRNALWFSAAEGFVTLSGILVGYIYAPKILHETKSVFKKLLRRAGTLYLCVIGLALFFITYSYFVFDAIDFRHFKSVADLLTQLLTLQYSFGWAEFLTHYVIFLIAAPFVLYGYAKGYARIILAVSATLWFLGLSLSEGQTRYQFTMSWQFLFIAGIFIGSRLTDIKAWLHDTFSQQTLTRLTLGLWSSAFILYALAITLAYGADDIGNNVTILQPFTHAINTVWEPINTAWFSWWTDKSTLAPLRLLFGVVIFWALFVLFVRFGDKINSLTNGFLMILGKKPLVAYSVGAVVIFTIEKYIPQPQEETRHFIANLIVTIIALTVTFLITKNSSHLRAIVTNVKR